MTVHTVSATSDQTCAAPYANTASLSASNNPTLNASASLQVVCPMQIVYTGTEAANLGNAPANAVNLSAQVAGSTVCTSLGTVTYSINTNPSTGASPFPVTQPVSGGVASGTSLSNFTWNPGQYTLTTTYNGPSYCQPATDVIALTVAYPQTLSIFSATGHYSPTTATSPYTITTTSNRTISLRNGVGWVITGYLSTLYRTVTNDDAGSGLATLTYGSTTVNNVPFTISTHANTSPNTFGIHLQYIPPGSLPPMPNSLPLRVPDGVIKLS